VAAAQPVPPGFAEHVGPLSIPRQKTFPLPPPAVVGCEAALEKLRTSGHNVSRAIASLTPERGASFCVTLPFGTISLFELADLTAIHVARHTMQVERALASV
jgi:hypothetical protein